MPATANRHIAASPGLPAAVLPQGCSDAHDCQAAALSQVDRRGIGASAAREHAARRGHASRRAHTSVVEPTFIFRQVLLALHWHKSACFTRTKRGAGTPVDPQHTVFEPAFLFRQMLRVLLALLVPTYWHYLYAARRGHAARRAYTTVFEPTFLFRQEGRL